jgi:hypothetical protein
VSENQVAIPDADAQGMALARNATPAVGDLELPEPSLAMADSEGIRRTTERVAAAARLTGQSRVLIAGCRVGDDACAVSGALALDLSWRLGIDTLLVYASKSGGARDAPSKAGGNGRPARVNPTEVARLWVMRCAKDADYANSTPPANPQPEADDAVAELQQVLARYRAAVIDLGVVRLDARMLAVARPEDPVLLVARYGCTRRDELAATAAIVKFAKCRIGGVVLSGYESPAADCVKRVLGFGDGRR